MGGWIIQWAVLAGAWLVFVGTFDAAESYVGAIVAALGAVASNVVLERRIVAFYVRPRLLLIGARIFRDVAADTLVVLAVLAERMLGAREPAAKLVAVPFGACGDDKRSAARRAMAIAFTTIAPNSLVLGIDRERRRAVFHQLRDAPTPPPLVELGGPPP